MHRAPTLKRLSMHSKQPQFLWKRAYSLHTACLSAVVVWEFDSCACATHFVACLSAAKLLFVWSTSNMSMRSLCCLMLGGSLTELWTLQTKGYNIEALRHTKKTHKQVVKCCGIKTEQKRKKRKCEREQMRIPFTRAIWWHQSLHGAKSNVVGFGLNAKLREAPLLDSWNAWTVQSLCCLVF